MVKSMIEVTIGKKRRSIPIDAEDARACLEKLTQIAGQYHSSVSQCGQKCDAEVEQFINEALTKLPSAVTVASANKKKSRGTGRVTRRPVGKRAIDYLLHVLAKSEPGLSISELIAPMQALGWTTTSETTDAIIRHLKAVCDDRKNWVERKGEMLTITEEGRQFVGTRLASLDDNAAQ